MFLITLLVIGTSVFYFIFQNEQRFWQERQVEAALQASETVTEFVQRVEDTLHMVGSLEKSELLANPRLLDRLLQRKQQLAGVTMHLSRLRRQHMHYWILRRSKRTRFRK